MNCRAATTRLLEFVHAQEELLGRWQIQSYPNIGAYGVMNEVYILSIAEFQKGSANPLYTQEPGYCSVTVVYSLIKNYCLMQLN